jgi:uncharacterized LabA/DUF88 family protein
MGDRSATFVDAGYVLAEGGRLCCGTSSRAGFTCDFASLTTALTEWITQHSGGLSHLRTYWYDGAANAVATAEHERIGNLPYVKVRLGRIHQGQQKGVDALIYKDLMTLARERAIARAYLVSGDEDLREGVIAAQEMGVQVILVGVPTRQRTNQSAALVREADEHVVLDRAFWAAHFSSPTRPPTPRGDVTEEDAERIGGSFAAGWIKKAGADARAELVAEKPRIPRTIDYELITEAETVLGSLNQRENLKRAVRSGFWKAIIPS